ncbi:MAG: zinc-binding dehydrogenase, partial [Acidimicrobiales bacterium]|nr:zinc-binding dehydrogenase [Acidimicrobiales bacterium]
DLHDHRLELARELGATHTVRGDVANVVGEIHDITGGGAHHTVDTTGVPSVMQAALGALRLGGSCGYVGVQQGDLVLDALALVGKTVVGVLEGNADPQVLIPRLIELWQQGRFPFDRLIETFPLSQIDEAEQASLRGDVVKPVLVPGA